MQFVSTVAVYHWPHLSVVRTRAHTQIEDSPYLAQSILRDFRDFEDGSAHRAAFIFELFLSIISDVGRFGLPRSMKLGTNHRRMRDGVGIRDISHARRNESSTYMRHRRSAPSPPQIVDFLALSYERHSVMGRRGWFLPDRLLFPQED